MAEQKTEKSKRKIVKWITVNGVHVAVYEGESDKDAYNRHVAKSNEETKQKQIAGYQKNIDKLNNLKSGKLKYTHK